MEIRDALLFLFGNLISTVRIMYDLTMQTTGSVLPADQQHTLCCFGAALRVARKQHAHTLQAVSSETRLGVATLRRAEQGDPTVRIGIYALLAARYKLPFLGSSI